MASLPGILLRGALGLSLGHNTDDYDEIARNSLVRFLIVAGVTLLLTFVTAPALWRAAHSTNWPSVTGSVSAANKYRNGTMTNIRYVVNGQTHELQGIRALDDSWRIGTRVPIYHHPTKPHIGVLTAGWSSGSTTRAIILGVAWLIMLLLTAQLLYRFRKASQGVLITDD